MPEKILNKITDISQPMERKKFLAQEVVNDLLSLINEREAEILRLRNGFNDYQIHTLDKIGKKMNSLSRERIRQLERQAIKNIIKHKEFDEIVTPIRNSILELLRQHGSLMSVSQIINYFDSLIESQKSQENAIKFLLDNFMCDTHLISDDDFQPSLCHYNLSIHIVYEILNQLENIFKQQNKILILKQILKHFKDLEYYKNNQEKVFNLLDEENKNLDKVIFSYLDSSNKFIRTPLDQWGLFNWEIMRPKRVNGKIYLVMLAFKKPMHFSELTQLINKHWSNHRPAKSGTVHNELISDPRFILVKRGTYGLKEFV